MSKTFKGRYYKHQKGPHTISVIVGTATSGDFVQILTKDEVLQYNSLKGCHISKRGIRLAYPEVVGQVSYGPLHPLKSPIMGPFHYLPMQCRHEIISMKHTLKGSLAIRNKQYDLNNGIGYIEGDYGRSFPKEYVWIHCNAFKEDLSIMVSIAHIPFLGFSFTGCICAILYRGKEYRMATYRGVRIQLVTPEHIELRQRQYSLHIRINPAQAQPLRSPKKGEMIETIHESNGTTAEFVFKKGKRTIFRCRNTNCSYEYNY